MPERSFGRGDYDLRPVIITPHFITHPEGSVLISFGDTKVICNASVTEGVPGWMKGQGRGWVTAEYSMLPRATHTRSGRESVKGKLGGRTQEISRLIGRSLRAGIDMEKLGENTIVVDCDVIQADGGTRTASITGGFVAMHLGVKKLMDQGIITEYPITSHVAAVSCGVVNARVVVDLDYEEDSRAGTDMNIVAGPAGLIEVQGSAEGAPFSRDEMTLMVDRALDAVDALIDIQKRTIEGA